MKRLVMVVAAALIACGVGCSKVEKRDDKIVVATDASYQPFEYLDDNRQIVGYDIDLFTEIGKRAGFEVEFVNQPFVGALAGLQSSSFDAIISAMTITDERKKTFLFSDPYYIAGQVIAVREGVEGVSTPADLIGWKIGVQTGTTGSIEAQRIENAVLSEYDTIDLAFIALTNGTVDAVINDEPTSRSIAAARGGIAIVGDLLTEEQYGIAMRLDQSDLAERINNALAEIKADGTHDALHRKWIAGTP
ncbi:MAG: basic amino acid ABC transporter substrate-binding protein [Candidatus Poribacteria bacterium]|nr:basic amino acid ABC transporter substrate-binding protein [Candidatus Poribacteria bacterium]